VFFCGSRVVPYPITDDTHICTAELVVLLLHMGHPGSLSSGLNSTVRAFPSEHAGIFLWIVIYGGRNINLEAALLELIEHHRPKAAFDLFHLHRRIIGDNVKRRFFKAGAKFHFRHSVLWLSISEGFKGTKRR